MLVIHCSQKRPAGNRANAGFVLVAGFQQEKLCTFYQQTPVERLGIFSAPLLRCVKQGQTTALTPRLPLFWPEIPTQRLMLVGANMTVGAGVSSKKMWITLGYLAQYPTIREDPSQWRVVSGFRKINGRVGSPGN
jgi:hypothetical protein